MKLFEGILKSHRFLCCPPLSLRSPVPQAYLRYPLSMCSSRAAIALNKYVSKHRLSHRHFPTSTSCTVLKFCHEIVRVRTFKKICAKQNSLFTVTKKKNQKLKEYCTAFQETSHGRHYNGNIY